MRVAVLELGEMNQAQVILRSLLALSFRHSFHLHAKFDVLAYREPGKKSEFLEDENSIGAGASDNFVIHQHVSRRCLVKPSDQVQQRGFSAARWSNNAEEFACLHFQVNVIEREQA